jgi:hypothetical protein
VVEEIVRWEGPIKGAVEVEYWFLWVSVHAGCPLWADCVEKIENAVSATFAQKRIESQLRLAVPSPECRGIRQSDRHCDEICPDEIAARESDHGACNDKLVAEKEHVQAASQHQASQD